MILLNLFARFFMAGLLAIGGGLAALPLMQELFVESGWITDTEFFDMLAVSQSTPGPIGINLATYIGFVSAGVAGACVATAGMVAPSLILLILIARSMQAYEKNRRVQHALSGIRPASAGLIATAFAMVFIRAVLPFGGVGWNPLMLFALLLAFNRFYRLPPLLAIAMGAFFGLLFL